MKIRRLEIVNFRGIKEAIWVLPDDKKFICLIGPGDSGKTALLDALHFALSDRYSLSISDTDFYNCNTSEPISIRVVVADLPVDLVKDSAFGFYLSGINTDGELFQDPEDGLMGCIIIQLKIDETHEPVWTVERVDGLDSVDIRSSHRQYLSTFKVDERAGIHLRWTKTSALGKLSRSNNAPARIMAEASRAASKAVANYQDSDIASLTRSVQVKINQAGGGSFSSIKHGLDTSLLSNNGNIALYEDNIPLMNYGLGTQRISSIAIQQMATINKSILLIDEVETGLEPHRIVRLMSYLRDDPDYSQVFVTTHSSIVVEQALTENLAIVRSEKGVSTVRFLPNSDDDALRLRRSRPSSFLANRIVVVEGKTEEGIFLECIKEWDNLRLAKGLPIASGEGSVIQDGEGGSSALGRARVLKNLGYDVAIFLDNDDRSVDDHVEKVKNLGVVVVRWPFGKNTEMHIADSLKDEGINIFLELAANVRFDGLTVLSDLKCVGLPSICDTLDFRSWKKHGIDKIQAKKLISNASISRNWFKKVDGGRLLGRWIIEHDDLFIDSHIKDCLDEIKSFIYPTNPVVEE